MVGRIFLTLLVLIMGSLSLQIIEQKIAPDASSDLVIDQVKNETSGAAIRIEQNARNWYNPISLVFTVLLLIWIWAGDIKRLYKKYTNPPKVVSKID